jgi:hypothetical protein
MSTLRLPSLLECAGCTLAALDDHIAVQDRDGHVLAHAPASQPSWLWDASTAALIERRAQMLGFCHELHEYDLRFRLWRPGLSREAAPWQTFPDALAWLARVERAVAQPRCVRFRLVRRPAHAWGFR